MAKFRKRWARVGVRQVTTQPADNDSAGAFLFQRQPPSRGEEQGLQSKQSFNHFRHTHKPVGVTFNETAESNAQTAAKSAAGAPNVERLRCCPRARALEPN